ncbi:MAG: DEAD/DEAH box helicase [Deltaproteobacteria bacterium]|nr:DEAD/DEAH box helicase [Deltaproteobacteria bacterium]
MSNQELHAVVMPVGGLQLEWAAPENGSVSTKSSRLLQTEIYRRFVSSPGGALLFLGFCDKEVPLHPSLCYWRTFAGLFARKLIHTPDMEILRHKAEFMLEEEDIQQTLDCAPLMTGAEYLGHELLGSLWSELSRAFSQEIIAYDGTVESFVGSYSPDVHLVGRIFFHLVENKNGDEPFAFLATYSSRLNKRGQSKHLPLKHVLQEYGSDQAQLLELLSTVHTAAKKSTLVAGILETGELFHPLAWSSHEAFTFLKEVPLYEESGILCRIPNWWQGSASRVRLSVSVGDAQPSFVGMDALLDFNAQLLLGDTAISEAEAKKLLEESEGLAFIKNKWVAVDPEKLRRTLEAFEKVRAMGGDSGLSLRDALHMHMSPEQLLGDHAADGDATVTHGAWLDAVMHKLCNAGPLPAIKTGKGFKARLRDYQQKGVNWLCFLDSLKFGACLADDMGLGKTVQLLGFLQVIKSRKLHKASLLVLPASLIANWVDEIARFAPGLQYLVAHPAAHVQAALPPQNKKDLDALNLVITTYTMVQKYEWLQPYAWNYVILDEAQAIKNPGTKQTRALKKLNADNRVIMTGTPIENRLGDLWSLFDFINPGLLGNKTEFGRFAKKLKEDPDGYAKLRRLIKPYILRRMKTDKSVIADLPEKVEMKTFAPLSRKQVVLYEKMVRGLRKTIEEANGIQRKGLVLASLIKCKQLCNHPDQYLGTGDYQETDSGKFGRLRDICETIHEKREKVLVFTQFKEMTGPLCEYLESIFERPGLVVHGSVPVGKRKKIIERFQSDEYVPFMVLSLKAGGVGLNLTAANHVIHFDRWWNPAVENQATDRAFRIGQQKNVVVHKFLTKGTVEERIDKMLEEKSRLSQEIIADTGEAWITEMNNDELLDLFKLTM